MSFGYALKRFREDRGLGVRELAKLCDIDHAYIHRLEKDEKTAPSSDVVDALVRHLKLSGRKARMFRFLVGRQGLEKLTDLFLEEEERGLEVFESAAQMSFRGKRPATKEEWRTWADRLDEMMG